MAKLLIEGRTNLENKFYIKIEADEKSMKTIKKIVEIFGSDYFTDNQTIPKTFSKYENWKDQWIPIITKDLEFDIICGNKIIHMIFYKFPSFEFVNNVLDRYCDWVQPNYKKGFDPAKTND